MTAYDHTVIGPESSRILLVQPVDDHDQAGLEEEYRHIRRLTGRDDFRLLGVKVSDWNRDLTPWTAPPVYGKEPFGDGAAATLEQILKMDLPPVVFLGGYSLAGLFSLWAGYQTDRFAGVAAVSPSVWFPGWTAYAAAHACLAEKVYLSLGRKEEKTRHQVMARVGDAIREEALRLGDRCILEWNEGGHFQDPALRTAKGFAWLLQKEKES